MNVETGTTVKMTIYENAVSVIIDDGIDDIEREFAFDPPHHVRRVIAERTAIAEAMMYLVDLYRPESIEMEYQRNVIRFIP